MSRSLHRCRSHASRAAHGGARTGTVRVAGRVGRRLLRLAVLFLPAIIGPAILRGDDCRRTVRLNEEIVFRVEEGRDIHLLAMPEKGEGYYRFTERFTGSSTEWKRLRRFNGNRGLVLGEFYRVPLEMLSSPYRLIALLSAFPDDRREGDEWVHVVVCGSTTERGETMAAVAGWFTGDVGRADAIAARNEIAPGSAVRPGQEIRIPVEWLTPEMRRWTDEQQAEETFLEYGADDRGEYALYRLRQGEALYSSVVIRFTGLLMADEVNEMAMQLARRSGIDDVTDIPIGYGVKIPLENLSPEFLPLSHPDRLAQELNRLLYRGYEMSARGRGLDGVTVILDPGHGGSDPGAMHHGIWEDDYVYDIGCRIKRIIEKAYNGRVIMTVRDRSSGETVFDRQQLVMDQDEEVQVNPAYALTNSGATREGVNFRWAMANYHFKELVAQGADPTKVVFTSIHADALHPSLRGAMIYVMGGEYGRSSIKTSGSVYRRREECRRYPELRYYRSDRYRSEGLSRDLANEILACFRENDLPIHRYSPIRDHVVRQRRAWSPAVLRNNVIPHKMLIEVCNMRNNQDGQLLASPAFRQKVAEAYVQALYNYFNENGSRRSS